ncbi:TPA: hypothetical protein ACRMSW_000065 [Pseudomonas aeruginosa]
MSEKAEEETQVPRREPILPFPSAEFEKKSTALCSVIFEELNDFLLLAEMSYAISPLHGQIFDRFKAQCIQFSHDMLLADGDMPEIARRLDLG